MKFISLSVVLFLTVTVFGQTNKYLSGYVVKIQGDTVFGKIKDITPIKSASKVKFMTEDGDKKTYTTFHLTGYKRGEELFVKKIYERPFRLTDTPGFMKLVNNGYIKLFEYNYLLRSTEISVSRRDYYIEVDGQFILIKRIGFKDTMLNYISDNRTLVDKIRRERLTYDNLTEIIKVYNDNKSSL